jgi:putative transposase
MPSTPAGKARMRAGRGVKIKGIHYWHPAFRDLGTAVSLPVLYDPFDVSKGYALVSGEWILCRSEYTALFERRTEREIAIISQEIRALHIQRGIHRQVKAVDIATFLTIARESETVLRQQRGDAQQLESALPYMPEMPKPLPPADPAKERQEDPWSGNIDLEIYGELK